MTARGSILICGDFVKRIVFLALGSFFVGLGALGIFLPILPTTPFLLLAAYFFARSSNRLYRWLMKTPLLGDYIRHYREGGGVPVQKKVIAILFLWLMLGYTAIAVVNPWWGKTLLFAAATGVSYHIIKIKTAALAVKEDKETKQARTFREDKADI